MTFSPDWEDCYANNKHLSIWPWTDLVIYVSRYAKRCKGERLSVLELGCGYGANIPFFQHLEADYYAVEGSSTAVNYLKAKFPRFADNIFWGDYTNNIPFELSFDIIVDRASLPFNDISSINKTLSICYDKLHDKGLFIGIDWYSPDHSEFMNGQPTIDPFTRANFTDGIFAGTGNVHFFSHDHLTALFMRYRMLVLEHKLVEQRIPDSSYKFAAWNFVAQK